jgi:hypothetical protein
VLEAARGGRIGVDSAHWGTFEVISATLWNSELCKSVYPERGNDVPTESVVDRLRYRSATRCDISAELEFVASHFDDFLVRPETLTTLSFSFLYEIIGLEG